jgi:hypothetical protein
VWAMLGLNQRPLPCEGRSITSWLFATASKYLQTSAFILLIAVIVHRCSRGLVYYWCKCVSVKH